MMMTKLLALCLALCCTLSAQDVALRAHRVHVGNGEILEHAVILVQGGRIAAVGENVIIPPGVSVIDLGDAEVAPGLVDAFSYAAVAGASQGNEQGTEVTPALRVSRILDARADDLRRLREAGVTTLGTTPGDRNVIGGMSCVVKARGDSGSDLLLRDEVALRINLGPAASFGNRPARFGTPNLYVRLPTTRMGSVFLVRDAFARASEANRPGATAEPDAGTAVLIRALEGRIPVQWEASSAKEILTALRLSEEFGIENFSIIGAAEAHLVAKELAAAGVPVVVGPLSRETGGRPGRFGNVETAQSFLTGREHAHDAGAPGEEQGADLDCCGGFLLPGLPTADPRALVPASGVPVLLEARVATALASGGTESGETLLDFARFATRAGVDPESALTLVTLAPARLLGVAGEVGSLEVGKAADLIILSGDPLAPTSAVRAVMIDGVFVHGDPTTRAGATAGTTEAAQ